RRSDYSNIAHEVKFRKSESTLELGDEPWPGARMRRSRPGCALERRRRKRRDHRTNSGPDRQRPRARGLPEQDPRRTAQPVSDRRRQESPDAATRNDDDRATARPPPAGARPAAIRLKDLASDEVEFRQ